MTQQLFLYLCTLPFLVLGDLLWVGVIANSFYNSQIGHLRGPVQWPGAILFYLVYTLGIIIFVTYPHLDSFTKTILFGALFGLVAYSVYNFTNHATLKDWSLTMVTVDILWGTLFTAAVAGAGHMLYQLIF